MPKHHRITTVFITVAEPAQRAPRSSPGAEACRAIEADLGATSPGRAAAGGGHGRLAEGERELFKHSCGPYTHTTSLTGHRLLSVCSITAQQPTEQGTTPGREPRSRRPKTVFSAMPRRPRYTRLMKKTKNRRAQVRRSLAEARLRDEAAYCFLTRVTKPGRGPTHTVNS